MKSVLEAYNIEYASTYGEPGYSTTKCGILLANWNDIPKEIAEELEKQCELEWSDEWIIDYDNSRVYRTQPDCYWWQPSFKLFEDGSMLTIHDPEWVS